MILAGKPIADEIERELRGRMAKFSRAPHLSVILIGSHPPSLTYVHSKRRACQNLGIEVEILNFPENVGEEEILETIKKLNNNDQVDGILVQFPLPPQLNAMKIVEKLDPQKDVDGFHPENMGKLLLGREDGFIPCTPLGISVLLEKSGFSLDGKHAVIVGRSHVVGRPLGALLVQNRKNANAIVTLTHSRSRNLAEQTIAADFLIVAVGQPAIIKREMVKEGVVIIDVGINRIEDPKEPKGYRLSGDVDFERILPKARAITPVPKGVGPMTVAMLLHNTVKAYEKKL